MTKGTWGKAILIATVVLSSGCDFGKVGPFARASKALSSNPQSSDATAALASTGLGGGSAIPTWWRSSTTGALSAWGIQLGQAPGRIELPITVPPELRLQGFGDFRGNGQRGMLWRNIISGEVTIWTINGSQKPVIQAVSVAVGLEWQILGTGDFNKDGKTDILWRNLQSGDVVVWLMDDSNITSSGTVLAGVDSSWQVQGIADLDGDGRSEVLWRNRLSSQMVVWQMNGLAAPAMTTIGPPSLDWQIQGLGDLNGDGKADILWRNLKTGEVTTWLMNGAIPLAYTSIATGIPLSLQVAEIADFNGDGKADILWLNTQSGEIGVWTMDGSNILDRKTLPGDGTQGYALQSRTRNPSFLNVREFGAVGDGTTDDFLAVFNAARALCSPENAGKSLVFPAGAYRLNRVMGAGHWNDCSAHINPASNRTTQSDCAEDIYFDGCRNVEIDGQGSRVDVSGDIKINGNADGSFQQHDRGIIPFNILSSSNLYLHDFSVDGHAREARSNLKQANPSALFELTENSGVITRASEHVTLTNLTVSNFLEDCITLNEDPWDRAGQWRGARDGANLVVPVYHDIKLQGSHLKNCGRQALSIISGQDILVENTSLEDAGRIGSSDFDGNLGPSSGVDIEPNCASRVPGTGACANYYYADFAGNYTFRNCSFKGSRGTTYMGSQFAGGTQFQVANPGGADIRNIAITGSTFIGPSDPLSSAVIWLAGVNGFQIQGSTFSIPAGVGIMIRPDSDQITIQANQFTTRGRAINSWAPQVVNVTSDNKFLTPSGQTPLERFIVILNNPKAIFPDL